MSSDREPSAATLALDGVYDSHDGSFVMGWEAPTPEQLCDLDIGEWIEDRFTEWRAAADAQGFAAEPSSGAVNIQRAANADGDGEIIYVAGIVVPTAQAAARRQEIDQLLNLFTYHPPQGSEDVERYERIREAGLAFATAIVTDAPASPDRSTAVRAVREAVMWANAAIATAS